MEEALVSGFLSFSSAVAVQETPLVTAVAMEMIVPASSGFYLSSVYVAIITMVAVVVVANCMHDLKGGETRLFCLNTVSIIHILPVLFDFKLMLE